jgi:hypothetical protein
VHRPVGQQRGATDDHRVSFDDAFDAKPRAVGEPFRGGQRAEALAGRAGDRLGDGML